ncbi:glycosyltransferase [Litoribacter populi]|uniref:glycosyltransferase n=1 Tax=Litoribacter populi TaxID=2598460 RepID=UPI00117D04FF|nr:glycosyltransferase [Litoribacter populi]
MLLRKYKSLRYHLAVQTQNLRDYLSVLWVYQRYMGSQKDRGQPIVHFELTQAKRYSRYLYLLIKFFLMNGHRVYIQMSLGDRYYFKKDSSTQYLFQEKDITFGHPPKNTTCLTFNDSNISLDYFGRSSRDKSYHIPIGQHPEMYFRGYWNEEIKETQPRNRSIIFIGSFEEKNYSQTDNENTFNVISRYPLYKQLNQHPAFLELCGEQELEDFLDSKQDHKLVILNCSKGTPICQSKIRAYLGRFEFFFAFPGVVMPLCHNIVEAMSAGCIPIMQSEYARVMKPTFAPDLNCLTFENLQDVNEKINTFLSLPQEKIEELRTNLTSLYQSQLTPQAIVANLVSGEYDKVYVLGEYHSVHYGWKE